MLGLNKKIIYGIRRYVARAFTKYIDDSITSDKKNENECIKEIIEHVNSIESRIIRIQSTNPNLNQEIVNSTKLRAQVINFLFQEIVKRIYKVRRNQERGSLETRLKKKLYYKLKKKINDRLKEKLDYRLRALIMIDSCVCEKTKYLLSKYEELCSGSSHFIKGLNVLLSNDRVCNTLLKILLGALKKPVRRERFFELIQSLKSDIARLVAESNKIILSYEASDLILEFIQGRSNCSEEFYCFISKLPIEELPKVYGILDSEISSKKLAEELYDTYRVSQVEKPSLCSL